MVRTSTRGTRNHIDLHDRNESLYNRRDTHGFCLYNNAAFYPWQFRWYLPCLIWDLRRGLKRINYTLYSQGPNHLMVYNVFTFKGLGQQTLGAMDRFHATFIRMAAQEWAYFHRAVFPVGKNTEREWMAPTLRGDKTDFH